MEFSGTNRWLKNNRIKRRMMGGRARDCSVKPVSRGSVRGLAAESPATPC